MAGSVNKVILIGNVGKDPEIRTFQNGGRVANLSLATSESWKDRSSGERREKTEWHRVVIFNENLVGVVERYVKKGAKLFVEGQLETRKWTDQGGQERYATEVVVKNFRGDITLLDSRGGGEGGGYDRGGGGGGGGFGGGGPDRDRDGDQDPGGYAGAGRGASGGYGAGGAGGGFGSGAGGGGGRSQSPARPADELDDEIPF